MKSQLVSSLAQRRMRLESGEDTVVGVNKFTSTEPSPLQAEGADSIFTVEKSVEEEAARAVQEWRASRDQAAVDAALARLQEAAGTDENLMEATLACARAGVTTGEWSAALRDVFGSYRAPTGVSAASSGSGEAPEELAAVRARVRATAEEMGTSSLRMLVGKPGLDGHSNGAEQIAVRARDAGMDVVYEGIRLTPSQIATSAAQEGVHVVGLSILSGSHRELIPSVLDALRDAGASEVPVVVGGIIPEADAAWLRETGVAAVYTPKDWDLRRMIRDIVALVAERNGIDAPPVA
jgi:(2R)-ethylmalonyl-CoA mutase